MIHGHTHMPGSETLAPGFQRHVLTDWDFDHCEGSPRAGVMRWKSDGIQRLTLAQAVTN